MHRCEFVHTDTGIVIGGAYVRPAPPPSEDAEAIQRALLRKQRKEDFRGWVEVVITLGAVAAMVAICMLSGKGPT